MKKNGLIIAALCVFCLLLSYGFDYMKPVQISLQQEAIEQADKQIPSFSLDTLDGASFESDSLKGEVALIHFWATWCPPCIVELPSLIKFAKEYPQIQVVAISTDFSTDVIERFLQERIKETLPDNFIILADTNGGVTKGIFDVFRLPETIVVSPEQEQVHWYRGDVDWSDQAIRSQVLSVK